MGTGNARDRRWFTILNREAREGAYHANIGRKSISVRGNSMCIGPETFYESNIILIPKHKETRRKEIPCHSHLEI